MTPCIEWRGTKSSAGYGQKRVCGLTKYVHMLSYETSLGKIPKGMVVRHKCDNPACYNPEHLELGTQKDNMQDCSKRGRVNKEIKAVGEAQGLSKLTESTVRYIRASSETSLVLADELGVSPSTIQRVRSRKTWRHI